MSAVAPLNFATDDNRIASGAGAGTDTRSDNTVVRINSRELFQHGREIEIDHEGRIYRLRLTQLNKLILNA